MGMGGDRARRGLRIPLLVFEYLAALIILFFQSTGNT